VQHPDKEPLVKINETDLENDLKFMIDHFNYVMRYRVGPVGKQDIS
jgi:hypothetical protein